ncbi:MAG: polyprenyl synthetase family protein [Planctomycetota bacterium]|nr:polyprenyl synthetase family protein [Planctomycetota bacterium]
MTDRPGAGAFRAFVSEHGGAVEAALRALLPSPDAAPGRLHEAMHYAMFPGGKRLRPMLALIGCAATGGRIADAMRPAAALECLHTYSLVHDDLPCMDDDDLRRGRATCHKVFGEPLALLAGDALLTLAFDGCASAGAAAVQALARAAGSVGMVGGQVEDLAAEGSLGDDGPARGAADSDRERLRWIHDHKTGALITASLVVGAHAGAGAEPAPPELLQLLTEYGDRIGRAFQIADDCLDVTGSAAELGKNPGADVALGKLTWPALLGLEASREAARGLAQEAAGLAGDVVSAAAAWRSVAPSTLDETALLLQDVAFYAIERRK